MFTKPAQAASGLYSRVFVFVGLKLYLQDVRISLTVLMLALITTARGSLGDDGDKVAGRYGNPAARRLHDDGTVTILYHKDRYYYLVTFDGGRSVEEKFSRMDRRALSSGEIAKFLKANAAGGKWAAEGEQKFRRSDGKAEANAIMEDGKLTLTVRSKR